MKLKLYQVDAFAESVFKGNPAAVCPLESWLADDILQKIAMENNQAETAFYVKNGEEYLIRWFTPTLEVDLCGHATLAAAFVIFNFENYLHDTIRFYSSRSGVLNVSKSEELLYLNFPIDTFTEVEIQNSFNECFNYNSLKVFKGKSDYMFVFANQSEIEILIPDLIKISTIDCRGIIATAKGKEGVDFVSRFFAPQSGINEDAVTGSAHTTLIPYWAKQLNKTTLFAQQLSSRKGILFCKLLDNRVEIGGKAHLYLQGEITI